MKNIYLIGFMGTGKTSAGIIIADLLNMNFVDTDIRISSSQGMSVPEIFRTMGEAKFRELETKELLALSKRDNTVISCGGGIPLKEENREIMRKSGYIFLLSASPSDLASRLSGKGDRPLLRSSSTSYIAKMMKEREPYYSSCFDHIINTDNLSPKETAELIVSLL